MYRFKLYNSDEVEALERELDVYKNALDSIQLGKLIESYLETKDEVYHLKFDFFKLEGDVNRMKEYYQETIEEYEKEEQELRVQIQVLHAGLSDLKKDVHWIKDKVEEVSFPELFEKMNTIIEHFEEKNKEEKRNEALLQQLEKEKKEKSEIELLKEEIAKLKEQINEPKTQPDMQPEPKMEETVQQPTRQPQLPRQSDFRQLQNRLHSSNIIDPNKQAYKPSMIPQQNFRRTMANYKKDSTPIDQNMSRMRNQRNTMPYDLNENHIVIRPQGGKKKTEEQIKTNEESPSPHVDQAPSIASSGQSPEMKPVETAIPVHHQKNDTHAQNAIQQEVEASAPAKAETEKTPEVPAPPQPQQEVNDVSPQDRHGPKLDAPTKSVNSEPHTTKQPTNDAKNHVPIESAPREQPSEEAVARGLPTENEQPNNTKQEYPSKVTTSDTNPSSRPVKVGANHTNKKADFSSFLSIFKKN